MQSAEDRACPYTLLVGKKEFAVRDLAHASERYQKFRGNKSSRFVKDGEVVDDSGTTIARVSYNGRVWAPEDYGRSGATPLLEADGMPPSNPKLITTNPLEDFDSKAEAADAMRKMGEAAADRVIDAVERVMTTVHVDAPDGVGTVSIRTPDGIVHTAQADFRVDAKYLEPPQCRCEVCGKETPTLAGLFVFMGTWVCSPQCMSQVVYDPNKNRVPRVVAFGNGFATMLGEIRISTYIPDQFQNVARCRELADQEVRSWPESEGFFERVIGPRGTPEIWRDASGRTYFADRSRVRVIDCDPTRHPEGSPERTQAALLGAAVTEYALTVASEDGAGLVFFTRDGEQRTESLEIPIDEASGRSFMRKMVDRAANRMTSNALRAVKGVDVAADRIEVECDTPCEHDQCDRHGDLDHSGSDAFPQRIRTEPESKPTKKTRPDNRTKETNVKKKTKKKAAPKAEKKPRTSEGPTAIVRSIWEQDKNRGFAEICKLAEAKGVNANTARGALVRLKNPKGARAKKA